MRYEERSARGQVARLRALAREVLAAYPIEAARISLVAHGYNTVFRVDTSGGETFALRLNINSRRTRVHLAAEMAWLDALRSDTDLVLPVPQRTRDGALVADVRFDDLDRVLHGALFSWLPGPDVSAHATARHLRAAGRAMATLHDHAERWTLPAGCELPSLATVLMGEPDRLAGHPLLSPDEHALVEQAIDIAQRHLDDAASVAGTSRHPLHADLHPGNMKWRRGSLAVFDFDDSAIGMPAQDLAISAYYLRDEAAMADGYREVRSLPVVTDEQFEAMIAARGLAVLNGLVETTNADIRAALPRFIAATMTKLRAFVTTGGFRPPATATTT